jgi:hypothetical protein
MVPDGPAEGTMRRIRRISEPPCHEYEARGAEFAETPASAGPHSGGPNPNTALPADRGRRPGPDAAIRVRTGFLARQRRAAQTDRPRVGMARESVGVHGVAASFRGRG